jgi:hypothetical protein
MPISTKISNFFLGKILKKKTKFLIFENVRFFFKTMKFLNFFQIRIEKN